MKLMKMLGVAVLIASSALSFAAAPAKPVVVTVGHVKAVNDLMVAMQMEKLMRTITGTSRFAAEEQRGAAYAKLEKIPKEQIYARLAYPLAKVISAETAIEMTRFYNTPHGKKAVYRMYNSKSSYGEPPTPATTAIERKDMERPEYQKASKELAAADDAIRHEAFVLLQAILK
ncbi:MAG: hypothetical protein V4631_15495 [Pseudomonadota bacterium]